MIPEMLWDLFYCPHQSSIGADVLKLYVMDDYVQLGRKYFKLNENGVEKAFDIAVGETSAAYKQMDFEEFAATFGAVYEEFHRACIKYMKYEKLKLCGKTNRFPDNAEAHSNQNLAT